ncbi:hypothetical protein J1N35_004663 [Gossypium stocksii]|uniref:Aminotransferase-like plant mobile domain-containing protein n=1 Tax=Gossypium stocksii TaxID=47602 RepID=A0A9D4AI88_9ROSI|nr:hypothetical protein J1N35_004663 [Gossypium stocksii]
MGYRTTSLIRMFELRANLISTLVERWHPETHTFHLPCRECTITLEDIALQLELSVDDDVVTGSSKMFEPAAFCYQLLGRPPYDGDAKFTNLKSSWSNQNFETLSSRAIEWEKMCAARAYILQLIGGTHAAYK